ncbi:MAG: 4Fe-4S binding protein [Nitrososphaeria archaeon]
MKEINFLAQVDLEKCNGCTICVRVCTTGAIKMEKRKAIVNKHRCVGCAACEQRCPEYAIEIIKRDDPFIAYVEIDESLKEKVDILCRNSNLHPEQVVCYCTATRAEEIAAAILKGAKSPEDVSFMTGARTGCKVECIEPILRLFNAAGIEPQKQEGGWQWYGLTKSVWDIPQEIKNKYEGRGFYFEKDEELFKKVVSSK